MPYLIKAHDYAGVLDKRMAVREAHLASLADLKAQGKVLFAAALLDDKGDLCGSTMFLDLAFAEIQEMLKTEPYITAGVWDKDRIEIIPIKVAPGFGK